MEPPSWLSIGVPLLLSLWFLLATSVDLHNSLQGLRADTEQQHIEMLAVLERFRSETHAEFQQMISDMEASTAAVRSLNEEFMQDGLTNHEAVTINYSYVLKGAAATLGVAGVLAVGVVGLAALLRRR